MDVFYDIRGLLARRKQQVRQGMSVEVWNGEHWLPYSDLDALLRYGRRLTEPQAVALIHETRNRLASLPHFSDTEARMALCVRGR